MLYSFPEKLRVRGGGIIKYMKEVKKNHVKVGRSVYDQRKINFLRPGKILNDLPIIVRNKSISAKPDNPPNSKMLNFIVNK